MAENALAAWRAHFPSVLEFLEQTSVELTAHESAQDPLTPAHPLPPDSLARAREIVDAFRLRPGQTLAYPPMHGPETPFPDHHPLRHIAALRTLLTRDAVARGNQADALTLALDNLAFARASLLAQEGIVPLIHACGIWQSALDGAHAVARLPELSVPRARLLLDALLAGSDLASRASVRALEGEYTFVFKVIVERMPETDDPDLFLSAVSTLGMHPPEPLPPGELGLGLTTHRIIDPEATLAAYRADLAPYLAALHASSRLPRGLFAATTAATLGGYRRDLGVFYDYSTGEIEPSLANITLARAALESTPNPGGKLLALFLTPPWESILTTAARREAQRSALCGLLAWRIHGGPTTWEILVAKKILPAPPADPFALRDALRYELAPTPRIWSVFLNATDEGGVLADANSGQPDDLVWLR